MNSFTDFEEFKIAYYIVSNFAYASNEYINVY